jgi:diguanylate cyclase (GGDEF)-like protein/PAS domain S-box-containing protein
VRVLLVEDNPGDARLIELLLDEAREAGRLNLLRLDKAATVREATSLLESGGFDIVLLDLSLPDAHGRDTFHRIQDGAHDLPVVALTGNDDEQLAHELVAAGAQDYLVKGQVDALLLARALRYAIERKRSEEKLRLAAQVFEIALEGILVADASRRIISVNRAFTHITGFGEAEVNGHCIFAEANCDGLFRTLWASQSSVEHWQGEATCRRAGGDELPVWLNVSAVKDAAGRVTHHVAAFNDITALKRTEERLRHLAHHDALTGLPNRILFQDRLEQAQAQARRNKSLVALLFLDLDRFKLINDTLGHAHGDALLKAAAERLRGCVREVDTVARLGGDEFAIVLGDLVSREDAAVVAGKALAAMARPFRLNEQELFVTTSIGIALYGEEGEDRQAEEAGLMERADIAMYFAKRAGRNSYQFYAPHMNAMSQQHLALETDLRRAVEQQEFVLHYQPQVDPASQTIVGVEALLRWQHPARGLVAPAEFIPLLEDTGLIVPVGEWVMRTACRQAVAWMAEGLPPLRMAVNLSARQLCRPDLAQRVAAILAETGLAAELLEIELTESIVMENAVEAAEALGRLKELGVRIALDDFGTGASSLGYLKHFPIDTLKISSAIIFEVDQEVDAAIAGAVIAMARNMKLTSVAEGVETKDQLDFLKRERCDSIQGYLISRPMAPDDLKQTLLRLRGEP